MKSKRHSDIIELITKYDMKTQEELTSALLKKGYTVTQATVSRDIKALKISKVVSENGQTRYAVNAHKNTYEFSHMANFVVNINCACNIIVIKTTSGMAQGVAAVIDDLHLKEVIGTIAGDDTIMIACTDFQAAENATKYFREAF